MDGLEIVAELMAIAARTAPKGGGEDYIVTRILKGEECERPGDGMIAYGQRSGKVNWDRDGENVKASPAVHPIGLKDAWVVGVDSAPAARRWASPRTRSTPTAGRSSPAPSAPSDPSTWASPSARP